MSKVKAYQEYQEQYDYWMNEYYIALGKGVCAYNDGKLGEGKKCNDRAYKCMSYVSFFKYHLNRVKSKGLFTLNENR